MGSLAHFAYRRRRIVLLGWIVAFIALFGLAKSAGSAFSNDFSFPDTDSTRAVHLLQDALPKQSGDTEQVVIQAKGGQKVTDAAVRADAERAFAAIDKAPHVSQVESPFAADGAERISHDKTIAIVPVTFDDTANNISTDDAKKFVKVVQSHTSDNVRFEVTGQVAESAGQQGGNLGLLIGIAAAAVVLFIAFGSPLAMLLPLITALVSLGAAISVMTLLTHVLKMPQFSQELSLLIGLGVGVDYALFIVTRHRQGLLSGKSVEDSAVTAVNTSGRAVLFAGITVCIAMMGMFALGISFFYGLAVAASLTVLTTMFAALTLQPALLGFFGKRVLRRKQRRRLAEGVLLSDDEAKGWKKWAAFIDARPVIPAVVAGGLVVALAIPFFSMRLGVSDAGNLKKDSTSRQAYDLIAEGFGPGFNGPYQLVSELKAKSDQATLDKVVAGVKADPEVAGVEAPRIITSPQGRTIAMVRAYPKSAPQDKAVADALHRIRGTVIPNATAGTDLRVYVAGNTAIFDDFAHIISKKLPLFVGVVVLLSLLLLMVVFRSVVVPITAAVMNMLSVGAAFGLITAVFQWGWGDFLLGLDRSGPIEAFLPVLFFAILFGLSMDYEVFLVSRIHEEWVHRRDNRQAVMHGLAATGRTITAAAAIMILVFAAFILEGERSIKEAGLGLAGAILIDALIIRSVLVPSLMRLFGKSNWWLPSWLDRALPQVSVEVPQQAPSLDKPERETEPART